MDPRIIWIASFSKSGNTWVRQVLSRYLLGEDWHPNKVANAVPHFCVHNVIRVPPAKTMTREAVANLAAQWLPIQEKVCANLRANGPEMIIYKTHNVNAAVEGHEFTNQYMTKKVVNIVRDPRDVVISIAHHYQCDMDAAFAILTDDKYFPIIVFPAQNPEDHFITSEFYSSWLMHYRSWQAFNAAPRLQMRYEDLKADPLASFRKIIQFIGLRTDDDQLEKTINDTEFSKLQAIETRDGFAEGFTDRPFFRRGEAGGWRDHPRQDIMRRIDALYGQPMKELGYL